MKRLRAPADGRERLDRDANDVCEDVRIAMGAVAPTPIRAHAAEDRLRGQKLTTDAIAEAARLAGEATCCIDDIRSTAEYRQQVAEALVRRLLEGIKE